MCELGLPLQTWLGAARLPEHEAVPGPMPGASQPDPEEVAQTNDLCVSPRGSRVVRADGSGRVVEAQEVSAPTQRGVHREYVGCMWWVGLNLRTPTIGEREE